MSPHGAQYNTAYANACEIWVALSCGLTGMKDAGICGVPVGQVWIRRIGFRKQIRVQRYLTAVDLHTVLYHIVKVIVVVGILRRILLFQCLIAHTTAP